MGQPSFLFNTQMTLIHEFEDVKCILMVFLFIKVRSFIANCVDILLGFWSISNFLNSFLELYTSVLFK